MVNYYDMLHIDQHQHNILIVQLRTTFFESKDTL